MSMPNNIRMGERPGRSDHKAKGVNERMGQGMTVRIPLKRGLVPMMGQGKRVMAGVGKWAKSINSAMGQGGR